MFLTPAYFEPLDLVLSTSYITVASVGGIPYWAIMLWILSGYIALILGLILVGHLAIKIQHPFIWIGLAVFFGMVLFYYFFVVNEVIMI